MKEKIGAGILAGCLAAGMLQMPCSARYADTIKEPLAQVVKNIETSYDGLVYHYGNGSIAFWDAENIEEITLTRVTYLIEMEDESYDADAIRSDLKSVLHNFREEMPDIPSSATTEDGTELQIYLTQDGTMLKLSYNPMFYGVKETELLTYLQSLPKFRTVQYEVVGYYHSDIYGTCRYDSNSVTLLAITDKECTLETADFPETLCIESAEGITNIFNAVYGTKTYTLKPDMEKRKGNTEDVTQADVYQSATEIIAAVPQIKEIGVTILTPEIYTDITPYLIDNGAISLMTRGDCDGTDGIGTDDLLALAQQAAYTGAGLDGTLCGTALVAADLDGNGKVDSKDMLYLLQYCAEEGAGLEPSWSEIIR